MEDPCSFTVQIMAGMSVVILTVKRDSADAAGVVIGQPLPDGDPGPGLNRHLQLGGRLPGLGADLARLGLRPRGRGEAARALHLHWSGQRGRG